MSKPTPQQIERFNRMQHAGAVHPYTCPQSHGEEINRILVATPLGLMCPTCDYIQQGIPDLPDFTLEHPFADAMQEILEVQTRILHTPTAYQLDYFRNDKTGEIIINVTLERVAQRDGSFLWAIREGHQCLSKDGQWIYDRQSKTDDFIESCRFASQIAAAMFWRDGKYRSEAEFAVRQELKICTERLQLKTPLALRLRQQDIYRVEWLRELIPQIEARPTAHPATNGFAQIFGAWPGNETDEEISKALEELG